MKTEDKTQKDKGEIKEIWVGRKIDKTENVDRLKDREKAEKQTKSKKYIDRKWGKEKESGNWKRVKRGQWTKEEKTRQRGEGKRGGGIEEHRYIFLIFLKLLFKEHS